MRFLLTFLLLFSIPVFADEPTSAPVEDLDPSAVSLRILSRSACVTEHGSTYSLPPGYFLPDKTFSVLDTELKRLQDAETRLTKENETLKTVDTPTVKALKIIGISFVSGIAVGAGAVAIFSAL